MNKFSVLRLSISPLFFMRAANNFPVFLTSNRLLAVSGCSDDVALHNIDCQAKRCTQ